MNTIITPSILSGTVEAPPSKSCLHRALICAALSDGECHIKNTSLSGDISATAGCLNALGAKIIFTADTAEVEPVKNYNCTPLLDCKESASTLRFLLPVVCMAGCGARLTGTGRLPERPMKPLIDEMKKNGACVSDGFPVTVSGKCLSADFVIPGDISSQFVSGILFALTLRNGTVEVLPPVKSAPYIDMTVKMLEKFGVKIQQSGNTFSVSGKCRAKNVTVEGDWSNSLCWLAYGVKVSGLDNNSLQGDRRAAEILNNTGGGMTVDASDIPDAVPLIAAKAAVSEGKTVITGASRLKYKESDRLYTTWKMLSSLGADITVTADGFIINGKPRLTGGTAETFNDHRIAFAAAYAAGFCKNKVTVINSECVEKSYPDFWEKYNQLGGKADVMLNG